MPPKERVRFPLATPNFTRSKEMKKSKMILFGEKCAAVWVLVAFTSPVWLAILAIIAVFWIGYIPE